MTWQKTIWLLSLLLLFNAVKSQDCSLQELKQFYKNHDPEKPLCLYTESNPQKQQIVLIRHGEPDLNKKGWRNRVEAIQFMQNYDSAIVIPFSKKPVKLENLSIDTIYHSPLPRAENTAQLASADHNILVGSSNFVEFERKVLKWPNMKMPTSFWKTASRVLWFMGCNDKGIESFKMAKKRAHQNAVDLTKKAEDKGMIILVAHGLHNKYVKKYLKKQGWKLVHNEGNNYLSVKVLARGFKKEKGKYKRTLYQACGCL